MEKTTRYGSVLLTLFSANPAGRSVATNFGLDIIMRI
jgi:hypothetical protein